MFFSADKRFQTHEKKVRACISSSEEVSGEEAHNKAAHNHRSDIVNLF